MPKHKREIISILDFIKTGKFGNVQIGQSMDEIRRSFPKPDDISDMGHNMFIWRYGAFEFHFSDQELFLLWCDNLSYMFSPGKKQFKLDRWILGKYKKFTLRRFIEAIEKENIKYNLNGTFYSSEEKDAMPDNILLDVIGTDTCIYFEDYDRMETDMYEYELMAIGSSRSKQTYKVRPL